MLARRLSAQCTTTPINTHLARTRTGECGTHEMALSLDGMPCTATGSAGPPPAAASVAAANSAYTHSCLDTLAVANTWPVSAKSTPHTMACFCDACRDGGANPATSANLAPTGSGSSAQPGSNRHGNRPLAPARGE